MASSNNTDKDSSSPKGSLPSKSDIDSEKDFLQKDKKSPPALPPPMSEKGSVKGEAPPPKSNDSNSSSKTPPSPSQSPPPLSSAPSPKESPSKKLPPAPPPPSPPVAPPPHPSVTPPHHPSVTPPPHPPVTPPPPPPVTPPPPTPVTPPPPPPVKLPPPAPLLPPPSSSPSPPPPSSPPPSPSSSNGENPSSSAPKQSPSSSDSKYPSSSKNSSNNSPPPPPFLGGSFPPQTHKAPPPLTRVEQGIESGSNHPSPHSPGLPAGSHTTPRNSYNDSLPSTSGGGGGAGGGGDGDGDGNPGKYVGIALAGVCIVVLVVICLLVAVIRKRKRGVVHDVSYTPPNKKAGEDGHYYGQQPLQDDNYKNGSQRGSGQPLGTSESAQPKSAQTAFSYESVMEITNGFSSQNIIGEGGFGCVYKGWLTDGRAVAVKKLKAGSGQGDREFRAEVEIISRVHHRHLVSLVGYCISEQQKILIYEFVPNGTLDHHLHGKGMPVLDWTKRVKIAIGAAKGLAYLHEDCNPKIIHRDIKSANILLDDAYVAQVSDFGLARLTDDANTHVSTRVMGTFGYMAPEYATSGKLTDRSDVFSFGVVLLELLTGRKPVDQTQPLGEESLVEWARPHLIRAFETGDFSKLIDPRLEHHFVESEVLRMIEAATACIRHSAPKRPRMLQVVRALDSECELIDLSNGVKYGQSTVYNSGQYDEEIMRFRMMNGISFGSSEFDMYSGEYNSRELSGFQRLWAHDSLGGESGSRAFSKRGSCKHTKEYL